MAGAANGNILASSPPSAIPFTNAIAAERPCENTNAALPVNFSKTPSLIGAPADVPVANAMRSPTLSARPNRSKGVILLFFAIYSHPQSQCVLLKLL